MNYQHDLRVVNDGDDIVSERKKEYYRYYDKYKRDKKTKEFYESIAWKKCRELALIRDNYLCQSCLKEKRIRKADMVHHIIELKDDWSKALDLSNLISWCNSCHSRHHKRNDKPKRKISNKIKVVVGRANEENI